MENTLLMKWIVCLWNTEEKKNQLLINQQKICMQTFLFELSNSLNGCNCLPTMAEKSCGTISNVVLNEYKRKYIKSNQFK